jgi:WD40 repeat protein
MINSSGDDRGPCLSRDGHTLFFSSNRPGGFGSQDLWMSYRWDTTNDFSWEPPVNLGPGVNTSDPDFGAAYIDNEWGPDTLLFGRRVNGGESDIYISERQWDGGPFEDAERVGQLSMLSFDDLRPAVRLDGLELYFHSNRPGSQGSPQGHDLWVAWRPSTFSTWSFPQNVGPMVNTSDPELYPALSPDARTLVFSSKRWDSRGGNDLYVSTRESEPWPYYDYRPY